jgi:hypothetical protein
MKSPTGNPPEKLPSTGEELAAMIDKWDNEAFERGMAILDRLIAKRQAEQAKSAKA